MREDRIADFSVEATGDLPPDLVGKARANIDLHFGQTPGGDVILKSGGAVIDGPKLLHCEASRFHIEMKAIRLN